MNGMFDCFSYSRAGNTAEEIEIKSRDKGKYIHPSVHSSIDSLYKFSLSLCESSSTVFWCCTFELEKVIVSKLRKFII